MPVQTQPVNVPFSGGVDEKTREELLAPPSFRQLFNLRMRKRGSYQKRPGNTPLGLTKFGGGAATGTRILSLREQLLLSNGEEMFSYSPSAFAWRQANGFPPRAMLTESTLIQATSNLIAYDSAYVNGYNVCAYVVRNGTDPSDLVGTFAVVSDASNGSIVLGPISLTLAGLPDTSVSVPNIVLVQSDTEAFLLAAYEGDPDATIWATSLDLTDATSIGAGWSVPTDIVDDCLSVSSTTNIFDAVSLGGGQFAIAYVNDLVAANNTVSVKTFDSIGAPLASTTITVSNSFTSPHGIGIDGSIDDVIWVASPWNNTGSVRVIGLDPSDLSIQFASGEVLDIGALAPRNFMVTRTGASTGSLIAWDPTSLLNDIAYATNFVVSGGVAPLGDPLLFYDFKPVHRPFLLGDRWYFTGTTLASDDGQLLIVDLTQTFADQGQDFSYVRIVGNPSPRLFFDIDPGLTRPGNGPRAPALSASLATMAVVTKESAISSAITLFSMDTADPRIGQPASILSGVAMGGSPPSYFDGVRVSEIGFVQRPTITSVTSGGTGISGTYRYIAVFEQVDSAGQWHQSAPSDPSESITVTDKTITISVTNLQFTNRSDSPGEVFELPSSSQIRIAIYRTKSTGTVYFRVPGLVFSNNPGGGVGVSDANNDSTLTAGTLYTQPGIPNAALPKASPPSFSCMVSHIDRLIGANGKSVWYSGQAVEGEGPWFSDAFQIPIEPGSGDITGLASIDGSLVVFKRNAILFIDGSGPPDNGAGNDFSPPQQIASDVGCTNPRSIVVTSDGVIFQSYRGLELLTRARQIAPYFGSPVEDTLLQYSIVTSAVLNEDQGIALFTLQDPEDADYGAFVCWDYVNQVWTTGVLGDETFGDPAPLSTAMLAQSSGPPIMHWASATSVMKETEEDYRDNEEWVTVLMRTAWIKGGILGLQMAIRAILLAEFKTRHNLTISVYYDYVDAVVDTKTWTADELEALTTGREELEIGLSRPECTAFQLLVSDATPTGGDVTTGQGAIFIGAQIDAADQGILVPLPEENRK